MAFADKFIRSPLVFSVIPLALVFIIYLFPGLENQSQSANTAGFLVASTNVISTSDQLSVRWKVPQRITSPLDWVGLFPAGERSKTVHMIGSQETRGLAEGVFQLRAPQTTGNYEFRYFSGTGFSRPLAHSERILAVQCPTLDPTSKRKTLSNIEHLIVIVEENHSFDNIFANYCKAPVGSHPSCSIGPECCETGPSTDPGTGSLPVVLDDEQNGKFDPNHGYKCEVAEMHRGQMDRFVKGAFCSDPQTFAYADAKTAAQYWSYAERYAMADHYFQPIAGASSSNDMYLARAGYMFTDNDYRPYHAVGMECDSAPQKDFNWPNIGDMFRACKLPFVSYAGGYAQTKQAPNQCPSGYDPSDIPFQYFSNLRDQPAHMQDLEKDFPRAVQEGKLPAYSFIKLRPADYEHPGVGAKLTSGPTMIDRLVQSVLHSPRYSKNTLILVTYDESGGYFDHIPPPPISTVDRQPYGPRIPFQAIGYFAKKNYISHVEMEHSSVVKFMEWNWFQGTTGQLGTRDTVVNNIGSLLDPERTGAVVPH